jgi:hypothetical protein
MKNYDTTELEILSQYHLRFYKRYLKRQKFYSEGLEVKESDAPFEKSYVFNIEQALEELDHDEHAILTHENLENAPKNWWMDYYSKSTYYRIKHRAYKRFIDCLHAETVL